MTQRKMARAVARNVAWFQRSGVMRPEDGFWGVAERIVSLEGNEAAERIRATFPARTELGGGVCVLEHRRPDCNAEAALMFDLAAKALGRRELKTVADNLLSYLLDRSCLRDERAEAPTRGLWGWANPGFRSSYWTDDNAWVATVFLAMACRGRAGLAAPGLAAAQGLYRRCRPFLSHVVRRGRHVPFDQGGMLGLRLNPHWLGLVTMAFAHAASSDTETDYAAFVEDYYSVAMEGPPRHDLRSREAARGGLPWALSEYAYLALTASVAAERFQSEGASAAARFAADVLAERQQPDGHFPAEHYETPAGEDLADFTYTQNWATLGLLHAARLFDEKRYRRALARSLAFLAKAQDRSRARWCGGAWRGLYDVRAGAWGGGDCYEGGAGSLYSGWTNAPIALAFLFEMTGESLFAS